MQTKAFVALMAVALAGCSMANSESLPNTSAYPPRSADFVSTVATPFLLVLKVPACVASAALAGPFVGASALVDYDGGQEARHTARQTVKQTCGPPYALTP